MKKILVLGLGAQGSTVAKRLDEHPNVSEIICADYDKDAVDSIVKDLKKAKGFQVNASRKEDIVKIAEGVDLIVNALPTEFGINVLDAALEVKSDYQDFTVCDIPETEWIESFKMMFNDYAPKFEAISRAAIISTGSAPGLINVVARDAMRYLDSCETVNMYVYEGVQAKRFLPFWWSPEVAYGDMFFDPYVYENGEIIRVKPYSRPVYKKFKGVDKEIKMVEHIHDEPILVGLNAKEFFKGAKNACFKYGGVGVDFAEPLYKMGMLSDQPVELDGNMVVPVKLAVKLTPPAPKYYDEIKEILDEGLQQDEGAMVVEAIGMKGGKDVTVETYVCAPGCVESFEKSGLTGEMYLTGQGGYLFTKLYVDNEITQKGVISSDMLTMEQVDSYLKSAAEFDITLDTTVKEI